MIDPSSRVDGFKKKEVPFDLQIYNLKFTIPFPLSSSWKETSLNLYSVKLSEVPLRITNNTYHSGKQIRGKRKKQLTLAKLHQGQKSF